MEKLVAYVGKKPDDGNPRALTDWHGKQIGTCTLNRSWPVRSYIGSRMYQVYAWVDGTKYTGRGFGESMSVVLKPCANQNR